MIVESLLAQECGALAVITKNTGFQIPMQVWGCLWQEVLELVKQLASNTNPGIREPGKGEAEEERIWIVEKALCLLQSRP